MSAKTKTKATKTKPATKTKAPTSRKVERLPWDKFGDGTNGRALTPELVACQLVDGTIFPDLPAGFEGFATEVEAEPRAIHDLSADADETSYNVTYRAGMYDEEYKAVGKAAFNALATAITAVYGKPSDSSSKHRAWQLDDPAIQEIRINLYFTGSPGAPDGGAEVRVRVRRP